MDNLSFATIHTDDLGYVYSFNTETRVLNVSGPPMPTQPTILRLHQEQWIPSNIRAIFFGKHDDISYLLVGISLTMYLVAKLEEPEIEPLSFKDIHAAIS